MTKLLIIALALTALPCWARIPLTLNRFVTCKSVSDSNDPVDVFSGSFKKENDQQLWCWFEFIGTAETIKYLDRNQSLVIRAIWRVGIRNVEKIEISITPDQWRRHRKGALSEVESKGTFTWRTYCAKGNFESNRYGLQLVTAGGDRILAQATLRAFEATIEIESL